MFACCLIVVQYWWLMAMQILLACYIKLNTENFQGVPEPTEPPPYAPDLMSWATEKHRERNYKSKVAKL